MIRCALVGFGYWGPNIARTLHNINPSSLSAICDQDEKTLAKAKRFYPQTKLYSNLDKLLKEDFIDAIIIASPAQTHYAIAVKALKSGKHILIEKPLTSSLKEANKLSDLANHCNQIVMVGHTFEFNPTVRRIKKIIQKKELGDIYYIYTTRVNLGQVRGDVNALWNLAPHDISIVNFLLDTMPEEVSAFGFSYLQKSIEDVVFVNARYPDHIGVHIHVSWLDPSKVRRITIVGSKKMLIFDDLDNEMPLKIYDKHVSTAEVAKGLFSEYKLRLHSGDIHAPQSENREPLHEEIKHFLNSIKKNKKPDTDVANGLNVIKVLDACQISIKSDGTWVKI